MNRLFSRRPVWFMAVLPRWQDHAVPAFGNSGARTSSAFCNSGTRRTSSGESASSFVATCQAPCPSPATSAPPVYSQASRLSELNHRSSRRSRNPSPEHKLHGLYQQVPDNVEGVCSYCAGAFDVTDAAIECKLKLLSEYDGHPSFRDLLANGYQVITFPD